jgi:hypothetical protein
MKDLYGQSIFFSGGIGRRCITNIIFLRKE